MRALTPLIVSRPRVRKLGMRSKDEPPPEWSELGGVTSWPPPYKALGRVPPRRGTSPISLSLGGVSHDQVLKGKSLF